MTNDADNTDKGVLLGIDAIKRVAMSASVILITAMSTWTDLYFGVIQGLCIAFIVFVIATQMDTKHVQPRLIKRVCILYCNQEVRKLFIVNDYSPTSIFSDILLAVLLAISMIMLYDKKSPQHSQDLDRMLQGLLYMYGDILDFLFTYGTFKITVCAFGLSIFLKEQDKPQNKIQAFCWQLAEIISANLLSQGITSMIRSSTSMAFIQIIACVSFLRIMLPSMESYLTYLAAIQLISIMPNLWALFLCAVICLDMLPSASQNWVGDVCSTYVIATVANSIIQVPFWGMILVLVLAHYIDFITEQNNISSSD